MPRFAFALLTLALLGAAQKPEPVAYTLSPEMKEGALQALQVEVRYSMGPSGVSDFAWAQRWAGGHALQRWARDFAVDGARSVEEPSPEVKRIHAAPGARLVVRYRVVSAYDHDPTGDDTEQWKPVIRPSWFYSTGYAVFGVPEERMDASATFRWAGGDSGLRFASDLEHFGVAPHSAGDVRNSVLVGDRTLAITGGLSGPDKVRVAAASCCYAFWFQELDGLARRIIGEERRFFGEDDSAPFLVAATPVGRGRASQTFGGAGLGDAFALWLDPNANLDELRWLIAHEYFHTWNAAKLGGFGAHQDAGPVAWLSEGFTDYYARALMVRAGVISPGDFARLWNRTLRDYAASPVRTAPNSRIAADFHSDDAVQALPYQRGAQLAALWNARLRRGSHGRLGLDDVIHAQYAWAKANPTPPAATSGEAAPDLFVRLAKARFGLDLSADIARYVVRGEAITLPSDVFGPCARLGEVKRPAFERGFDPEATAAAGNVAQRVRPGSTAYAAGLRDGMKLISRDGGEIGEAEVPYVLTVDDHGTRRVIRYLPKGEGMVSQRRLELVPGREAKTCTRSLSGL